MIDHYIKITFKEIDRQVISQVHVVFTGAADDGISSLRFQSAPCRTKSDATCCALIYIQRSMCDTSSLEKAKIE